MLREFPARVQESGRVQLPADIRREFDVSPGDYLVIEIYRFGGGDKANATDSA
jgi:AbrB family looped-hinge helix DNA binding protein